MPWFAQARDAADGRLFARRTGTLHLDWNINASRPTMDAVVAIHQRLAVLTAGMPLTPLTWTFGENLVTPHPLGGCNMGVTADNGVVDHRGEVFGHPNLFVADGAVVPEAHRAQPVEDDRRAGRIHRRGHHDSRLSRIDSEAAMNARNSVDAIPLDAGLNADVEPIGWGRLRKYWVRLASPARYERLQGELQKARVEIGKRVDPAAAGDHAIESSDDLTAGRSWKDSALALLRAARQSLEHGRIDQGWKFLNSARRMEIFGMDAVELTDLVKVLRAESSKLKPWRQRAIEALVGKPDAVAIPNRRSVMLAASLRDEEYDNRGYKDQLIGTQFLFLGGAAAIIMGALLGMWYRNTLPFVEGSLPPTFTTIVGVMLFGKLGATFSAITRASDPSAAVRIPEITSANRLSLLRILLGGVSAIVVYLGLKSELASVFAFKDVLKSLTPFTIYVVAFASGFTDRLVMRAIEALVGKPAAPAGADTERGWRNERLGA